MTFHIGQKLITNALSALDSSSTISGVESIFDLIPILEDLPIKKPLLIVLKNEDELDAFCKALNRETIALKDISSNPYTDALISSKISCQRLKFFHQAQSQAAKIFVSYPNALLRKTLSVKDFNKHITKYEFADLFFSDPNSQLEKLGYRPTQFVESPGQYSNKGGIIDVFSPIESRPVRVEIFGNDIESIHFFSTESQRTEEETESFFLSLAHEAIQSKDSLNRLLKESAAIPDNTWKKDFIHKVRNQLPFEGQEQLISLFWEHNNIAFDFFTEAPNIIFSDKQSLTLQWQNHYESIQNEYASLEKNKVFLQPESLYENFQKISSSQSQVDVCSILVSDLSSYNTDSSTESHYPTKQLKQSLEKIKKDSDTWSSFVEKISSQFKVWTEQNKVILSCPTQNSIKRATAFFKDSKTDFNTIKNLNEASKDSINIIEKSIFKSIKYSEEKTILIRYSDIFNRETHSQKIQKTKHEDFFERLENLSLSEIKVNDLVVHVQHGVGMFKGLKDIDLQGVPAECLEVHYAGQDKLFLPVHKINQLKKFTGGSQSRSLDKLGGSYWKKTKDKVKSKLKDIAEDLIQLYAQRRVTRRQSIPNNTKDNFLFQSQFPFEETADQLSAIYDVYKDFSNDYPMDRLICGDVGFGKTEVAMRAAFLAASEGKQVAVLAPTTVLSLQHLNSFKKRFAKWPINIRGLNRFIPRAEVKKTLDETSSGQADIVVGTHRLLSADVKFKNLGLLIIDEEQKFGVKQKERIKKIKSNIDVLSLSATPIPRTLNMGFLGVRDLSLITTPPKDRMPVKTFVSHYSQSVIKKSIESEIKRGGQVYFIHNRVQSIYTLYDELKEIMPDVRIGLGHGQMNEKDLENIVVKFFNKEIDVLLATTIVESGLDISNANTIIINNAQNFGLSQLYQLRGRVGRSEKRAFCYLLVPPNKDLEKEQKNKLKVLQDYTELGSGIQIAHHDLEMRGAGNLLGEAQSGHAEEIGYDFYIELLEEALSDARGESPQAKLDPEITVPLPALIPSSYIKDLKSRLYYYRKLNRIKSEANLDDIETELKDQFGQIPQEVFGLFFLSATKNLCKQLGVTDLKSGPKNISLKFIEAPPINHDAFLKILKIKSKKYKIAPDQRLLISKEKPTWEEIYNEVSNLKDELVY